MKKLQWDTGQVDMEQRNSFTRLCATDKTRFLDYSDKADIMTADSMSNSGCVMYRMTSYNHQYNIEYSLIDRILSSRLWMKLHKLWLSYKMPCLLNYYHLNRSLMKPFEHEATLRVYVTVMFVCFYVIDIVLWLEFKPHY